MSERSVSTDALETLGHVHSREEKRDAIHLAVMPVTAGETLKPGADIWVSAQGLAFAGGRDGCIGIVDPFLTRPVVFRERFWLVIYPRKITSLRHVWSHPALPEETVATVQGTGASLDEARLAVHELAVDLGISDEEMMDGAKTWLESGGGYDGYMRFGVDLNYGWDMDKFWAAYALLTGESVPEEKRTSFFSCAC